ncbi:tripartite tricarboxylate transporter substrate binding protein [Bordetella petrii]|nr:tripartite tricarboxylate transporter substrate binding protein [Bordetella petrii]
MNASFRSLMVWVAFVAATFGWPAHAQTWKPQHSIEFVVPAGPGAALDTAARELQRLLEQQKVLDQTLVITNKPGGSGAVGLQTLRAHEGDSHWLGTFTTGMISARVLHPDSLSYDQMTPIALLLEESMLVAVRADSPIKNVHDLVAQLKKKPDSLSIAVATSVGNHIHLAIAKPLQKAGVDITKLVMVPYKSSGESITALLGGHVDVVSATSPNVLAQYKAGTIRLLAVSTAERLPEPLAEVPTWKEQGIDAVSTSVQGVLGPKNMSPEQLEFWENAFAKVTASQEWQDFLKTQLWRPRFARHDVMQQVLDAEYASTRKLLLDLNLAKP